MSSGIRTVRDAALENRRAKEARDRRLAIRVARAKVRRWERLAAKFGGAVHQETLARFQARLADLTKS